MRAWCLLIGLAVLMFPSAASAGTLTHLRDYLSRQQANLTIGQSHQIFFQPATPLGGSSNQVILSLPDGDDGWWCRTSGALSVSGIANPEGATEGATPLPGSVSAVCTIGSGLGSTDQLVVSNVGPLSAGTVYGVQVSDGVGRLGTPPPAQGLTVMLETTNGTSTVDTQTFFLSVIASDVVQIGATVVSTSGPPANPTVQFKGRASPGSPVTLTRDGSPIASLTTDAAAKFDTTLPDQPVGQHTFEIAATDAAGLPHTPMTFALNLTAGSTTVISGIFFGPTIHVDKDRVKLGENITFSGTTAPESTITLTVQSVPRTYVITVDPNGRWKQSVNTQDFGTGAHTASAMALAPDQTASDDSLPIGFFINPLAPCDGKPRSDLNCDGRVNLTDFSILLFFWLKRNPSNVRADINTDGQVTIVDFSIMLFQWSG